MYISINQALNFWDELIQCYYGVNGYGGNVCEIYISSMMEHSSLYANNPTGAMSESERRHACEAMADLVSRFEDRYSDATVTLHEGPINLLRTTDYDHRVHFCVTRTDGQNQQG